MKYAVLYLSNTGNTELIASAIFGAIESNNKTLINVRDIGDIPHADMYFVGFPVYKQSCSLEAMELLDKIDHGKIAIFITSGLTPTDKYKDIVERNISVWINESSDYLGMYMCQGKTSAEQVQSFLNNNPEHKQILEKILKEGAQHPNFNDIEDAKCFVKNIFSEIE